VPSHAVELTSAFLDRAVADTLARHRIRDATRAQKERLAALIHLCGVGSADRRRTHRALSGLRCGDRCPDYVAPSQRHEARIFAKLAARDR
jgi:hypothetical protein